MLIGCKDKLRTALEALYTRVLACTAKMRSTVSVVLEVGYRHVLHGFPWKNRTN